MSMFSNYLDTNYIPNNIKPNEPDIYISEPIELPYKMYDIKNNLVGLCWSSEDKFQLKLSLKHTIYVEPESLILTSAGKQPTPLEAIKKGLKAYNTVESKSWTCVQAGNKLFWSEDPSFQYPKNGLVPYTFSYDMLGKDLIIEITNFRYDVIKSFRFVDTDTGFINIGVDDFKLEQGLYHINCYIDDLGSKKLVDIKTISVGRYDPSEFNQFVRKDDISYKKVIYDGSNVSNNSQTEVIYNGGSLEPDSAFTIFYDGGKL